MNESTPTTIPAPAPTAWPLIVALAISLVFTGLVTHVAVSIAGAVVLIFGAVGWWYEVLPNQKEEAVAIIPVAPVLKSSVAVDYLARGHRPQIPAETHSYWSGVWGGLAGSVAMAAVAMLFGLISAGSIWYPINLLAAG